ncbi:hypothetical protein GCM10027290_26800 [Micromonospora sonneratiae]|uniref:DUF308 domain-containing protein n=1 Tax=Micromonospora sonneratiae TaxID=1184706 RepID=A0ABW3YDP3_9ACTN
MRSDTTAGSSETTVTDPLWVHGLMWLGFPLLGALAGWLLKISAHWIVSLPWAPLQGPFKLIASIPEPQAAIGAVVVGALAGLVFAFLGAAESLTVTVATSRVILKRGSGAPRQIARGQVDGVFLDGRQLVLLGRGGQELAREKSDLAGTRLTDAFRRHSYPWLTDGDPYRDEYRRWVPDIPDLPTGADALFKARERALRKGDHTDQAELRDELAKLGIVVRDEDKRQYWRRSGQR